MVNRKCKICGERATWTFQPIIKGELKAYFYCDKHDENDAVHANGDK